MTDKVSVAITTTPFNALVSATVEYGTPLNVIVALAAEYHKEENLFLSQLLVSVAEKYAREYGVEPKLHKLMKDYFPE